MDELISRRALLEAMKQSMAYRMKAQGMDKAVGMVQNAPTIDPVRHGCWRAWNGGHPIWLGCFCSVCENHADSNFAFCPNCGAKMDAEEEKDE